MTRTQKGTLVLCVLALVGCDCGGGEGGGGPSGGSSGGASSGGSEVESESELPMGTVEGVVRLAEGAATPRYDPNPFEGENAARRLPDSCTPARPEDAEPMHVLGGRALTNVPVIATGDPDHWPRRGTPELHEIHFDDCRPSPPVVVMTRGDRLRLVNDDDYPFFPHLGPGGFFEALLRAEPREMVVDLTGPQTMVCEMTSVCGNTEIVTLGHPVHTISGEDGHFSFEVPADQEISLLTYHPLLADPDPEHPQTTRVAPGATVTVEIIVRPRAAAVPAPAPAPSDDPPDEAPF